MYIYSNDGYFFNDDGVTGRRALSQVTAMQCNMLTIYYYAYVGSSTCCVANKVTLSLTLLLLQT